MSNDCLEDVWDFDRKINLNHGSFGATPRYILNRQRDFEDEINKSRELFFRQGCYERLAIERESLAKFLKISSSNIALVDNVTEGFNSILQSMRFNTGDEVLVTNHIYGCFIPVLQREAKNKHFKIVTCDVPCFPQSNEEIIESITREITPRTRLVILEHITSDTALKLPIRDIVNLLSSKNIETLIDGAHAPGQIDINISEIVPTYYIGNNHKWLCAPVASGFLYVDPSNCDKMFPSVGSHTAQSAIDFKNRFDWQGTKNLIPKLLISETISYMASLNDNGWKGITKRNHDLAVEARALISRKLKIDLPYDNNFFGSMFVIPIENISILDKSDSRSPTLQVYDYMQKEYGLAGCITTFGDRFLLRVSCHLYNDLSHYQMLADAIVDICE